jgi:maltooligosyltrehalose synthase
VHARAFYDSDEDGMGDFRGLTEKLDYLQDLGITAIWLLPFFPSPWRDDGYDISDYNRRPSGIWHAARFPKISEAGASAAASVS